MSTNETTGKNWRKASLAELDAQDCPCGEARRAFTEDPDQTATIHLVDISEDVEKHYHKEHTEIYLILEGEGYLELDDEKVEVKPLDAVMIKPGCRHRAVGDLRIVNIPIPSFDPEDEWFD
jgi:mannose-6-phosphate isomerase-like protein (cupin superfamily)